MCDKIKKGLELTFMKVGYQGAHGTFSEIAVQRYFEGKDIEARNYTNFVDILNDLDAGILDAAMLPVENSTTGTIYRTYDLLHEHRAFATGEQFVRISEHLIGIDGASFSDVKEVYSHPEALNQCSQFFRQHPHLKMIPYQDTAKSVEYIKNQNDPTKAALASFLAAEYYGCPILMKDVNDLKSNTTRFLCVEKKMTVQPDANKVSLYLVVNHEPGALYQVIKVFAEHKINMLKLESRPLKGQMFEYCFYVDFEGNINDDTLKVVLGEIVQHCVEYKLLGCYSKADSEDIR